ncbi:MAG TPA: AraC family transcriptional regulator [Pyrinomonadaceae bacterium]|jgi:AraC-type DNA-binding domain-containing proteins
MVTSGLAPENTRYGASWDGIRVEHWTLNGGELPAHRHREHTVLIVLSDGAKGEFRTESGKGMCGTQTKGSVAVVPSGLEHSAVLDGPSEHLSLFIDPAVITRAGLGTTLGPIELIEKYKREDDVILNIGLALKSELYSEGLGGRLFTDSLANLLAVHLLRHYAASVEPSHRHQGGLSATKLRQIKNFITDNYARDLRLHELADVAGMSRFHFSREFKRSTGTTPHQYLIRLRVDKAKSLLAEDDLSLTEVGLRSGFSHQSHFTRLFRRLTGTTPSTYRAVTANAFNLQQEQSKD